jgi:hypothetical protein
MAFAVITTVYIEAVDAWMEVTFPNNLCPSQYKEADPKNEAYKAEAWDDWQLDREDRQGLMGCYCTRHSSIYLPWSLITTKFDRNMPCLII